MPVHTFINRKKLLKLYKRPKANKAYSANIYAMKQASGSFQTDSPASDIKPVFNGRLDNFSAVSPTE